MSNNALVSVIIPVHNCERYLAEAIESVLTQTYRPIEIIVVDDGSTDGSANVAKRFTPPVRYHFQPQSGAGAARNRGTELARGNFFAFLDADDLWLEKKLALQMAILESDPGLDMVFGHVEHFHSPELDDSQKARLDCPREPLPGYLPGTMLIREDDYLRAGAFDSKWKVGEFVDWYIRAMERELRSVLVPETLLKRRVHGSNIVIRERKSRVDYVRILKASLDRRRKKMG
jgi:glycosyltransferase involved in cell wall biosynthesis